LEVKYWGRHMAEKDLSLLTWLHAGHTFQAGALPKEVGADGVVDVYINEGFRAMVDGSLVYHRGFGDRPTPVGDPNPSLALSPLVFSASGQVTASRTYPLGAALPPKGRPGSPGHDPQEPGYYIARRAHWASYFPDRTLIAETGSRIRLRVHNQLKQQHELLIHDAGTDGGDVTTGPISPGATGQIDVPAPVPGTYLYSDPSNAPVERTLGLYGGLVVIDPADAWRLAPQGPEFERQWLWICHDVVPEWAEVAGSGGTVDPGGPDPTPRYFTLNGYSGFQSLAVTNNPEFNEAREEDTLPSGHPRLTDVRNFSQSPVAGTVRTGQLIRTLNAGIVDHQLHFHGNHVWMVRANGLDFPRSGGSVLPDGHVRLQHWEDTVSLAPLERKEMMLPVVRPPDTVDAVWSSRSSDWKYPMHCHAEPSQTAAGGVYPGGLLADWVLAADEVPEPGLPGTAEDEAHHVFQSQVDFASDQPHEGSPETEHPLPPNVSMELDFFNRKLTFPGGAEHEVWSFENDQSGRGLPGPLVRATEGDIVHATIKPSKRVHTIHWHGIEPDPRNDGVGHTSFEVTGHYTYQWRPDVGEAGNPNRGAAGTYFYHCHVNTPLHVQMGMFGPIIIDPRVDPANPTPPGTRRLFVDGPAYDIATETLLAPYSLDPRWHELNHAAGLSGEDVGLNRFEATEFYLLGGNIPERPSGDVVWTISSMRANSVSSGLAPTLVRMVNVDYFPTRLEYTDSNGNPVAMAELISHDGRPFRETADPNGPAIPVHATGNRLLTSIIASGAAEKYDFLLRPPGPGEYYLNIQFLTWGLTGIRATRTVTIEAV
jgi:FtsP/CotA-like multicopper oxidase with cupredoxin domain